MGDSRCGSRNEFWTFHLQPEQGSRYAGARGCSAPRQTQQAQTTVEEFCKAMSKKGGNKTSKAAPKPPMANKGPKKK